MPQAIIQKQLNILHDTLEELKGLLAWEELKQSEARPGEPPGFVLGDTLQDDIKNQYSRFLAIRLRLHGILNNLEHDSLSDADTIAVKQKLILIKMEREFQSLNLFERFIKF